MTTRIRIYYDTGAEPVLDARARVVARPDVKNAFPGLPRLSATTGFTLTLPIPPGGHTVCVYAENTGRAGLQNSTVGCRAVQVPWPRHSVRMTAGTSTGGRHPGQCFGRNACPGTRRVGRTTPTRRARSRCGSDLRRERVDVLQDRPAP